MGTNRNADRPWILLPGTLCTGAVFDQFLDALNVPVAARHVVRLCHPNVEDYAQELARMVTPGAVVCGFSLGAIVAAHLANRLPASQMLFFGLHPHADDPAKRDGRQALAQDVARLGGAAAIALRLPPLAGPDPIAARALVLNMADASAQDIETHTSLALNRPGALKALARTQSPVAFLTGTDDTQAPLSIAQDVAQATPQGRVVPLKGLGHYALVENPALCAKAAATLLEKA